MDPCEKWLRDLARHYFSKLVDGILIDDKVVRRFAQLVPDPWPRNTLPIRAHRRLHNYLGRIAKIIWRGSASPCGRGFSCGPPIDQLPVSHCATPDSPHREQTQWESAGRYVMSVACLTAEWHNTELTLSPPTSLSDRYSGGAPRDQKKVPRHIVELDAYRDALR